MALVTVQRTSCSAGCVLHKQDEESEDQEDSDDNKLHRKRSGSECYFAVKGAALVLPHDECIHVKKNTANGVIDIQSHLQSMFYLLRPEDTLKMAVKLECSRRGGGTRYLVVVSSCHPEESCLLGVDCPRRVGPATLGLVLPIWASTTTTLDGDGGFSVASVGSQHIFKPVSVQAMWSALQSLHKATAQAQAHIHFPGGSTHLWVKFYEEAISSDQSCLNEWHAMDDLVSKRPPSPDSRLQPTERHETEKLILHKLKEVMMSVDLDEVTSKYIRTRLESELDADLSEYKPYIDSTMLTILGQMDAPAQILSYLYLGSEWNASNLHELKLKGVGHILNVTREIDNFFPGVFDYLNIRVWDDEMTDLLPHWDRTYRYISKIRDEGSKVLVHCKMGISRSASVVIAYLMKAYGWKLDQAMRFVKEKRSCVKPNGGFLQQLEIYQGILDASKQRHNSLWRSKSETNLQSPAHHHSAPDGLRKQPSSSPHLLAPPGGGNFSRPKSWSPDDSIASILFPPSDNPEGEDCLDSGGRQSIRSRISELEASAGQRGKLESGDSGINLAAAVAPADNKTFSYEKEDIPWTPGMVLKTKQQLEAKSSLKRASSFESVLQSPASPSSQDPSPSHTADVPLQRSQSFRYPSEQAPFDTAEFRAGIVKRLTRQLESKMTSEEKLPVEHLLPPPLPSPKAAKPPRSSGHQRHRSLFPIALYHLLPSSGPTLRRQHGKTHPLSKLPLAKPVVAYHTV